VKERRKHLILVGCILAALVGRIRRAKTLHF